MTVPEAVRRVALLSPGSDSMAISSHVQFIWGWEKRTCRSKRAELVLMTYWSAKISAMLVMVAVLGSVVARLVEVAALLARIAAALVETVVVLTGSNMCALPRTCMRLATVSS